MSEPSSVTCAIERPTTGRALVAETAWDALDRFLQQLQAGRQAPDQYGLALSAIREATGSAVAFLYSIDLGRVVEISGDPAPSPRWCREFSTRLHAEFPEGGVWKPADGASGAVMSDGRRLTSALLLPVKAPRQKVLVALSADEAQPLQGSDLRAVKVIWRLQAGNARQVELSDKLRETLFGIVRCLSTAIDAKDSFTCGHSERVARIAVKMGEEMKLARGEISDLYLAGLLHDVGKIGIRDDVLLKPGPLTPEEATHMREHPVLGDRIVANVTRLAYLRPGVRGHHERFDGKGYPDGLAGEAIPLMARILAVADSCDAMMSNRRYRGALPADRIESIFREGAGTQWDPSLVDVFFTCRNDLYAVCQRGLGQSVYMAVERAAVGEPSGTRMASAPARGSSRKSS